jgi:tRNA pseudouridine38-40 synthase
MGGNTSPGCMRVALKFAYNGVGFSGYARQPGQKTIEEELVRVLSAQGFIMDVKHSCFRTASRTDRGVSALGNVCAFDTEMSSEELFKVFPLDSSDVFVYGIHAVAPGFYPRHANRREYRYYLRRNDLDIDAMLSAAGLFTGEHNFQNFARVEPLKDPVRTIDLILVDVQDDFLVIDFSAQTFLWNQIRRVVSALQKVGSGALCLENVRSALDHPERKVDFQLASAEPLFLKDVIYDFSFTYIKGYKKKLRELEQSIVSLL